MSYRYTRKKQKTPILFFVGLVFLLVLLFTPALRWGYELFEKAFVSASHNTLFVKQKAREISFKSRAELVQENRTLKKENERLRIDNSRMSHLESFETQDSQIEREDKKPFSAKIISKKYNKHCIIDRGRDNGVFTGQPVLSENGSLLGFVSELFDMSAKVTLLTAKKQKVQGILFPRDITVDLIGNGNALVAELDRDVELEKGDLLYSQDSGFIIGSIAHIDFDPRDPVKKIFVAPLESLQEVQLVHIRK